MSVKKIFSTSGASTVQCNQSFRVCLVMLVFAGAITPVYAAAKPAESFTHKVTNGQETYVVRFKAISVRSENFQAIAPNAAGKFVQHETKPPGTYMGTVDKYPGAMACAMVRSDGAVFCALVFEDGAMLKFEGGPPTGVSEVGEWEKAFPEYIAPEGGSGGRVYESEVGVFCSYGHYKKSGQKSVDALLEIAEYSILVTNLCYVRDLSLVYRIGPIMICSSEQHDPFPGKRPGVNDAKKELKKYVPKRTYDQFVLVLGDFAGLGGGDSAMVGARKPGFFYPIWRHEVGHCWGAGHRVGGKPEGNTLMSGNSFHRLSGPEQAVMLRKRNMLIENLKDLGPFPLPVPPRASIDRIATRPTSKPILVDVLGNDSDANGEALTLVSVSPKSRLGGKAAISRGTGRGGRDQVTYTMAPGSASFDYFTYRIRDAAGGVALGYVMVRPIYHEPLMLHWSFDDPFGSGVRRLISNGRIVATGLVKDYSNNQLHGLPCRVVKTEGVIGIASRHSKHFGKENDPDIVRCKKSLGFETNRITIAAWVKSAQPQDNLATVFKSADRSSYTGLCFSKPDKLGILWGGKLYGCPLEIPTNKWSFCAVAVEPDCAVFYVDAGKGLKTAEVKESFPSHAFNSTFVVGGSGDSRAWSMNPENRIEGFVGDIDEVRVFSKTLSPEQIRFLANKGGTAYRPAPEMDGTVTPGKVSLKWAPMPAAKTFKVYLGNAHIAVAQATEKDPQFKATVTKAVYPAGSLPKGTYFWRVDCSDGAATLTGPIWTFKVQQTPVE